MPSLASPVSNDQPKLTKLIKAVLFALLWSTTVCAAYLWHFTALGWAWDENLMKGGVPFAIGAFASGMLTSLAVQSYGHHRSELRRFCTYLLLLVGLTLAITLGIFVLHYRIYFSTWHADFPSIQFAFQTLFTGLAAVYLFLGTGLKVFLPLPLACALGFAYWHAKQARPA